MWRKVDNGYIFWRMLLDVSLLLQILGEGCSYCHKSMCFEERTSTVLFQTVMLNIKEMDGPRRGADNARQAVK